MDLVSNETKISTHYAEWIPGDSIRIPWTILRRIIRISHELTPTTSRAEVPVYESRGKSFDFQALDGVLEVRDDEMVME